MSELPRRVFVPNQPKSKELTRPELLRQIRALETRLNNVEDDISSLGSLPTNNGGGEEIIRDARWNCKKCGKMIGLYDKEDDVIRTRYKEHVVYVRCGPGGFIQVICRGCSYVNTQSYAEPEECED